MTEPRYNWDSLTNGQTPSEFFANHSPDLGASLAVRTYAKFAATEFENIDIEQAEQALLAELEIDLAGLTCREAAERLS